jgi:orotate phosphoribosyltransferase
MPEAELRTRLLKAGLVFGEFSFSGGQKANHKLELDYDHIKQDSQLYLEVIDRLAELAEPWQPDFVVGVPNGATRIGLSVGLNLKTVSHCVQLRKDDGHFSYSTLAVDAENARRGSRGVIVEDVVNRRTNTLKVLNMNGLGEKIVGAVAIWDRAIDNDPLRQSLPIELKSIVTEPVPSMLPDGHEFWGYA